MGRKSKYSIEEKLEAVQDYKSGKRGTAQLCSDLNIRKTSLYNWISIYEDFGELGFLPKERSHIQKNEKSKQSFLTYSLPFYIACITAYSNCYPLK